MYSSVGERIYLRAPAAPLLWATTGGVSKSLPDFCRSQLCTVVHGHALCNGRDRKKQPKFKNLVALRTRGSWVQVLPGAPIFNGLRAASEVVSRTAGRLRDLLSTGRTRARSRHAARCAFLDDSAPGSP